MRQHAPHVVLPFHSALHPVALAQELSLILIPENHRPTSIPMPCWGRTIRVWREERQLSYLQVPGTLLPTVAQFTVSVPAFVRASILHPSTLKCWGQSQMNREWLLLLTLFAFIPYFSLCVYDLKFKCYYVQRGTVKYVFQTFFPMLVWNATGNMQP